MKQIERHIKLQTDKIILLSDHKTINAYGEKEYHFKDADHVWVCLHSLSVYTEEIYIFFQGKPKEWISRFSFFKFYTQIYRILSSKEWISKTGQWIDIHGKRYIPSSSKKRHY